MGRDTKVNSILKDSSKEMEFSTILAVRFATQEVGEAILLMDLESFITKVCQNRSKTLHMSVSI